MSLRLFRDHGGREWRVWDVTPYPAAPSVERRRQVRRREVAAHPAGERRAGGDRRRNQTLLTPGLESGWLCFEGPSEKRRLTPIPAGWQNAPEADLERMLGKARLVSRMVLPRREPAD
jgi:hypothetical protein